MSIPIQFLGILLDKEV